MIKLYCKTNMDLERCEVWPSELPEIPREGDLIESGHEWTRPGDNTIASGCKSRVTLRVCRVTWKARECARPTLYCHQSVPVEWIPEVALTMPLWFENMTGFYDWYGRITGKGK